MLKGRETFRGTKSRGKKEGPTPPPKKRVHLDWRGLPGQLKKREHYGRAPRELPERPSNPPPPQPPGVPSQKKPRSTIGVQRGGGLAFRKPPSPLREHVHDGGAVGGVLVPHRHVEAVDHVDGRRRAWEEPQEPPSTPDGVASGGLDPRHGSRRETLAPNQFPRRSADSNSLLWCRGTTVLGCLEPQNH